MMIESECIDIRINGLVQGVGFRPFMHALARQFGLTGWVRNTSDGVLAKVSGDRRSLMRFIEEISTKKPENASIDSFSFAPGVSDASRSFSIMASESIGARTEIPPDVNICKQCSTELMDPSNRRYKYPFITCSECGPRFTILKALPFDRPMTAMSEFNMCRECQNEYDNPDDRRFHAQTISCPACGPSLSVVNRNGHAIADHKGTIPFAVKALLDGKIIALKGIGGYQLVACADNDDAIDCLRKRKNRPEKPLAVMVENAKQAHEIAYCSPTEEKSLCSKAGPIVLLEKKEGDNISIAITKGLTNIGIMLPTSPLHKMLLHEIQKPLVVTSGNRVSEPIALNEAEALDRLGGIADFFLIHNRAIYHRADDSVVRIIANEETLFRNGRGYAPRYLKSKSSKSSYLALGGHLKNSFALSLDELIILSQHIGDLSTVKTCQYQHDESASYLELLKVEPTTIIRDDHPDYASSKTSITSPRIRFSVQHHKAHLMSCVVENDFCGKALGVAWDGLGFGENSEAWGGEFFLVDTKTRTMIRKASFLPFKLLGGDKAAREPRRNALSVAHRIWGDMTNDALESEIGYSLSKHFSSFELTLLLKELNKPTRSSEKTTSVGRLFDATASFLDLKQFCSFEGQAAMLLEDLIDPSLRFEPYKIELRKVDDLLYLDWRETFREVVSDIARRTSTSTVSTKFHYTLVHAIELVLDTCNLDTVLLSGGVFQNKFLVEKTLERFSTRGLKVYWNKKVPPNDGGLSVGQLAYKLYEMGDKACV